MNVSGTTVSATGHKQGLDDGLYDKAGARPDLDLDFARTKSLIDRVSKEELVTFHRTTGGSRAATYIDENGLVQRARHNLLKYSHDISNSGGWGTIGGTTTVVANTTETLAPDGTQTATKCGFALPQQTADNQGNPPTQTLSSIQQGGTSLGALAGDTILWSIYLKSATGSNQTLNMSCSGTGLSIITVTNEWQRFEIRATRSDNNYACRFGLRAGNGANFAIQASNGVYPAATRSVYAWGAQAEKIFTGGSNGFVSPGIATELIKTTDQGRGVARFTHDPKTLESKGLLAEHGGTNLITFPRSSNGFWQTAKSTTDSNATNPDGSTPAYHNNNQTENTNTFDATSANSDTLTFSVFIKQRTGSTAHQLNCEIFKQINNPANNNAYGFVNLGICARFDVSTGEFASVTETNTNRDVTNFVKEGPDPNGWYRIGFTVKNKHVGVGSTGNGNNDGVANTNPNFTSTARFDIQNTTAYIWGPQVEKGNIMTSYIPTDTTQVTRSPDLVTIDGDNFGTYRTNLQTNSENFSDSSIYPVQQTMVQDYAGVSPTGNYDASLWTATTTQNIGHTIRTLALANIETGATYTVTVHAKPTATENSFYMNFGTHDGNTGTNEGGMKFQLTGDGVLVTPNSGAASSSSIDKLANGWYRCRITTNALSQNTSAKVFIKMQKNGSFVAANPPEALLIWGLQVEKSSTMTEYIDSTGKFDNRQSNATFVDSNGIIRTSYANHVKYSEELDQTEWVKSGGTSITANNVVAPDGTTTADTWSHDSTRYGFYNNTASDWMSAHSQLLYPFTITDEWVRYSIPVTTESGQASMRVYPLRTNNNLDYVYQTSITVIPSTNYVFSAWYKKVGTKVYVWGCQLVRGTVAGSYYKTTDTISGPPRYSYDPDTSTPTGLYLEPAAENLATDSANLTHLINRDSTKTQNAGIAPDGTNTAVRIAPNTDYDRHGVEKNYNTLTQTSKTYSIFVKADPNGNGRYVQFGSGRTSGGQNAHTLSIFDAKTGQITDNIDHPSGGGLISKVESFPNGWYRLTVALTATGNATNWSKIYLTPYPTQAAALAANNNDLTTTQLYGAHQFSVTDTTEHNILIWGHQVESGLGSTSYIPTSGVAATRTADIYASTATEVLDRANGTKPAFYTTDGISIFTKFKINHQRPKPITNNANLSTHSYKPLWQLATSTTNVEVTLMPDLNAANGTPRLVAYRNSDPKTMFTARQFIQDADVKSILRYLPDDNSAGSVKNRLVTNDGTIVPNGTNDANGHIPLKATLIQIGGNIAGTVQTNGTISRLTFWKTPFDDEKLLRITG